jgi:hypothetical protein
VTRKVSGGPWLWAAFALAAALAIVPVEAGRREAERAVASARQAVGAAARGVSSKLAERGAAGDAVARALEHGDTKEQGDAVAREVVARRALDAALEAMRTSTAEADAARAHAATLAWLEALLVLWSGLGAVAGLLSEWGRRAGVRRAAVFAALGRETPGTVDRQVFSTVVRESPVRIEVGFALLGAPVYTIHVAAPRGAPLDVRLGGVREIVELARVARIAAAKDAALGPLADSLMSFTSDWRALFRGHAVESVQFLRGEVVALAGFGASSRSLDDEARRVLELIDRLVTLTGTIGRVLELKARAAASSRCPYCHDEVPQGEGIAATTDCKDCGTRHHAECFAEHGRCAVYGCGPRPRGVRSRA